MRPADGLLPAKVVGTRCADDFGIFPAADHFDITPPTAT